MAAREFLFFGITLLSIRTSGRRSFGRSSTFDACITVLLCAVLDRGVVGADTALAVMHRLLALACIRFPRFENMVSGRGIVHVRAGQVDAQAMWRVLLTERNLAEAIRQRLGDVGIETVGQALLERDGKITVIGCGS